MATRFSNPANVPMGNNRLSPVDQANAIAYDTAVVQSPFTNKDGGAMLRQATSNLAADSNAGRYGVAGIGDLGQFAGSFDPANVPMGNNRLSPVDQYKAIAYDTAIMDGTAPIMPRNKSTTIANLGSDSDVGRFAVPGYGDQGQFAGSFDPALSPMGSNRLSPVDQYKLIKQDAGLLSGDVTLRNYSGPLPFGTTEALNNYEQVDPQILKDLQNAAAANLGGDSDVGRFAVPGYGDQGQFFGGDGGGRNTKNYDDISASAFAKGGDVQMPQEAGANPFADPNTMAVYDQMRQTVSPKEFGDEMLAGAAQIDPEAMAQFRNELSQIDLSPEDLDMLNNMVDEILATPEQYAAVRAKYLEMGAPEELLPEQFDPQFFAAMNMAVDQLIAEPAGVQAFAKGGIAELKPIAKAIAGYGRNGDTMLAHITPAEARMLRRRGGSGTINPTTGLPEFFLKKAFKGLAKVVKNFASSSVGRVITAVAIGFFLGPAAVAAFGATAGTVAAAAITGFTASAGSSLLAGDGLKTALKQGVVGAVTAGAVQGVGSAIKPGFSLTGQAPASGVNPTAMEALTGQYNKVFGPSATASGIQAPVIDATGQVKGIMPTEAPVFQGGQGYPEAQTFPVGDSMSPVAPRPGELGSNVSVGGKPALPSFSPEFAAGDPGAGFEPYNKVFADAPARVRAPAVFTETPVGANEQIFRAPSSGMADVTTNTARDLTRPADTSYFNQAKNFYNENISPSGIQQQGATDALNTVKSQFPGVTTEQIMNAPASSALGKAYASAMPGILSTYGPMTALGLGAVGLAGGFKATDAQPSEMRGELMKPVTQRIAEGGNQRAFYVQGLPGVKYDQYGAPIFGQYKPLPTFDTGLGIESLINPRGFAAGGAADKVFNVNNFDQTAYLNAHPDVKEAIARGEFKNAYEHYTQFGKAEGRTAFDKTETAAQAAKDATEKEAAQAANRKLVADAKTAKKAAGFGSAYQNINAGLSYDAPAGIAATSIAARQAAFKPTMDKFTQAQAANVATLAKPYTPTVVATPYNNTTGYTNVLNPVAPKINYDTTPELTAAQKAAADKLAADAAKAAADKAIADKLAADKAIADKLAADKAAADKVIADKLAADRAAAAKAAADKAAADRTLFQGQSAAVQNQQIMDYLKANPNATDQTLAQQMDYFGIKSPQVAQVVGMQDVSGGSVQNIDRRYGMAKSAMEGNPFALAYQNNADAQGAFGGQNIRDALAKMPNANDAQIAAYMDKNAIDPRQMAAAFAGTPGAISAENVLARYQAATKLPAMVAGSPQEQAAVAGGQALLAKNPPVEKKLMNMGGIASLGSGGYPRRTGQINGPGTATSDSIPAMLSDGEFVMTAKAVRGAGKGNRRAGAKRMYALMNQLEKNAARG